MVRLYIFFALIICVQNSKGDDLTVLDISGNRITVKSSQDLLDIKKFIYVIKKGREEYKFKIEKKLDKNEFVLKPVKDIKSQEICQKSCTGIPLKLSPIEEFEIYYRLMVPNLTNKEEFFSNFSGVAALKYSTAGAYSVGGKPVGLVYHYGMSAEKFIYKSYSKNILYGFSAGIGASMSILNLSNVNFNYIPEVMKETTVINIYAPYTFQFVPFKNVGFFGGINLNASITPYLNKQTSSVDDVELNRTASLTGGFALGYHAGINIFWKKYLIQLQAHQYNFTLTENLELEMLDNGSLTKSEMEPKNFVVDSMIISVGLGLSF